MQPTRTVWTEIDEAFRQWLGGDAPGARTRLEAIAAAGWMHPFLDLGLAYTRRDTRDLDGAFAAAAAVLAAEPRNAPAMIIQGDVLKARGETRAAVSRYATAVQLPPPTEPAPMTVAEVARANAALKDYARDVADSMERELDAAGVLEAAPGRFRQSLAIARGDRKVYPQRPLKYFYPGLPLVEFYEPRDFAWTAALEAAAGAIHEEAERVLEDRGRLTPYVANDGDPGIGKVDIAGSREWTAFFLVQSGMVVEENTRLCPQTMAALEQLPLARADGATPSVLFSVLEPGAHIPPHNGMLNTRLICHLPVIAPAGCTLRVGGEHRDWRYGETLIFDDSVEHEAWNRSDQTRVVLLFDIWRPELSEAERLAVGSYLALQARHDKEGLAPSL